MQLNDRIKLWDRVQRILSVAMVALWIVFALIFTSFISRFFHCPLDQRIRLIVRGDDMGFCHAANVGCIEAYQNGILTCVEVMPPCVHFDEAVQMLNKNPGLDVGVHLTLTSEWDQIKWGPLTDAPSLTDENGHFFPATMAFDDIDPAMTLKGNSPKISEIEGELRAQIELAQKKLPHLTHFSVHMGFESISPAVRSVISDIAKEYDLDLYPLDCGARYVELFDPSNPFEEVLQQAVDELDNLKPGTWILYDHPGKLGLDTDEITEGGWGGIAETRDTSTRVLIDPQVREVIERRGIELINYRHLKKPFWKIF
ncbi:ChbG/HpnK family deacetylase [candidate division KSB1 bacterium]|nr:ChbG/HpnK family deacetylase [candidate division KSB1 bacterium]